MPPAKELQSKPTSHTKKLRYVGNIYMPRRFGVCNEDGTELRTVVFGAASGKAIQDVHNADAELFLSANKDRINGLTDRDKFEEVEEEEIDIDALLADFLDPQPIKAEEEPQKKLAVEQRKPQAPETKPAKETTR